MKKGLLLGILVFSILLLFAFGYMFDRYSTPNIVPTIDNREPHIEIAFDDSEVSLVGVVIEEWMKWETGALDLYNKFRSEGRIYSARSVVINWGIFDIPEGSFILEQCFELSKDEDFQTAEVIHLQPGERSVELYHLLVDMDYFFRVTVTLDNKNVYSEAGSFTTKWSPRIIEFENLRNVRDVGGWKTTDGKTIKQEMLYRGCELDGANSKKYILTPAGLDIMLDDLKIKGELDLRTSHTEGAKDMLGVNVKHQYVSFMAYSEIFTDYGRGKMKEVFDFLSDETNYPVYLHCSYGADRTGTVCYILEALLGVSEENCYRDWELSILTNGEAFYEEMEQFLINLQKVEGATLQEKAENYLLSIGITKAQIENIRKIMLED